MKSCNKRSGFGWKRNKYIKKEEIAHEKKEREIRHDLPSPTDIINGF
jgi:hypothetical protein